MTITEALADVKTLVKRIEKKQQFIGQYLGRHEALRDPLESDGGSRTAIERERQAIGDLQDRLVKIRTAIQQSNHVTPITVEGVTRTVAEWLTWRKEVAPRYQQFVTSLRGTIDQARRKAQTEGRAVVTSGDAKPGDLIINLDEMALAKEAEQIETILGTLDGQLSLKNATVMVDV